MCDDVQLCNHCVREFLIMAHIWFAFGLPCKTGCDTRRWGSTLPLHRWSVPQMSRVRGRGGANSARGLHRQLLVVP
jgi:hypothetical protein